MFTLPRVCEFMYKGTRRVAIEKGPDNRGCGLFTTQLVPEIGHRTFKPEKMMNCRKLGLIATIYYLIRSARIG